MNHNSQHLKDKAHAIMMSETFQAISTIGGSLSVNIKDEEELTTALATCLVNISSCLDNKQIEFKTDEAEAFTLGLLSVVLKQVLGEIQIEKVAVQ